MHCVYHISALSTSENDFRQWPQFSFPLPDFTTFSEAFPTNQGSGVIVTEFQVLVQIRLIKRDNLLKTELRLTKIYQVNIKHYKSSLKSSYAIKRNNRHVVYIDIIQHKLLGVYYGKN